MSLARSRNPIRITTSAAAWTIAGVFVFAACAASKAEIREAQSSGYDADFAIVYGEALGAVEKLYPSLVENATTGVIRTAWHPLRINVDGSGTNQPRPTTSNPGQVTPLTPASGTRNYYFVRFTVKVSGGDPWRIEVSGQASRWDVSGVPVELRGGDEPPWLAGRIAALRVDIHERLAAYAVKLEVEPKPEPKPELVVDLDQFGDIPPAAAEVVAAALTAGKIRDFTALGATMHEQFTWNLGAPPSARDAMIMWQADSSILPQLVAAIEAGCRAADSGAEVTCPPASTDQPGYTGYRVAFRRGPSGVWQMTSFVSGD